MGGHRGGTLRCQPPTHLLKSAREAARAVRYVLENRRVHGERGHWAVPAGVDPFCSAASAGQTPAPVARPRWWMLRVGVQVGADPPRLAG
jgi:hypothetical protein